MVKYQLTGIRADDGQVITITRNSKREIEMQKKFAKKFGAKNLRIKKLS